MNNRIAILGAGSWGTAVALHLAKGGFPVLLWGHRKEQVALMAKERENSAYLPGRPFPPQLTLESDLNRAIRLADYVLIAVPSHAFASLIHEIKEPLQGLSWLTKGVDPETHLLLSELIVQRFGAQFPIAVISGPSFAEEVADALPTALTIASNQPHYQKAIHQLFHHGAMRVYLSEDYIGVQICGAIKNILAIASGISDGLGYGANAKAALITRGLAEMQRLGLCLGAKPETFLGLAGVGDLVLTCTDDQSRNRRFGLLLGQNLSIQEAEQRIGQVVEGKNNAIHVCAIALKHQIEMPICEQISALLQNKVSAKEAVAYLMGRPAKEEGR